MPPDVSLEPGLTVEAALESATRTLARAGFVEPRRDAVQLLADRLGWSPGEIIMERHRLLAPERRRWLEGAVARRVRGEPLGYVTGLAGFRRLVLACDRRALIPRPETEGLVDRALILRPDGVAVDVGTGTGCLGLALRQEGRYRSVIAIDRAADALALAADNGRRSGLPMSLVRGDLLTSLGERTVDVVVSNPPYLTEVEYLAVDSSVRDYEPREALVSGTDGLDATRELVRDAARVTRPGGFILVEIAAERARESAEIAAGAGWRAIRVEEDLFRRPRYLIGQLEA